MAAKQLNVERIQGEVGLTTVLPSPSLKEHGTRL